MHWGHRLKLECDRLRWGPTELAAAVPGLSYDSAKKYLEKKVAQPRGRKVEAIAEALGLRLQWLRDGAGDRYITGNSPPEGLPPYTKRTTHGSNTKSTTTHAIIAMLNNAQKENGSVEMQKTQYLLEFISLWSVAPADIVKEACDYLRYKVETSAPDGPAGQGRKPGP